MDLGCGTGAQIFHMAAALPNANFVGIDISIANIEIARQRCSELSLEQRVEFVASDYMQFPVPPQDVITAYSTLHLIQAPSEQLFGKISSELAEGGLLMNVMPYECVFNQILLWVRRLFILCRSPLTDAIVFKVGKALHGAELDDAQLRERVSYMYQVFDRLDGADLHRLLKQRCGLECIAEGPERHASIAQAKHRFAVFRKCASRT
jgi:SAM-dependent methyltransferase